MSVARVQIPSAFRPLTAPARYKGAYGGRGGGKSHFFATYLLLRAAKEPGLRIVCIREVQNSIKESVKRLLEDKIALYRLEQQFTAKQTEITTPGDGLIIFKGMQHYVAHNIKSLEGYDVAWVEEAESLSARSLELLTPTIRRPGSELWFSWNPDNPKAPVDALLRGENPPEGSIAVEVGWRDNPWFPEELRKEMEYDRDRDPEKYAHVWGGAYRRRSEARVFHNYRVGDPGEFPAEPDRYYLGADWGFASDPTVLIRCSIDARTLYVDWEAYEVGCEIDNTPALFDTVGCPGCEQGPRCGGDHELHGMARKWPGMADSARPETISYVQRHGYPKLRKAKKGPGSVEDGIEFLQSYDIVVHPRCEHTIEELGLYSWKVDPQTGEILPVLEDKNNHVIDALRYALESVRRSVGNAPLFVGDGSDYEDIVAENEAIKRELMGG